MKHIALWAILVVVGLTGVVQAATVNFINATPGADYATGANWSSGLVPSGTDTADVGNAGSTRSATYSSAVGYTAFNLYVGDGAGSVGTLTLSGSAGTLAFNGGTWQNGVYIGRDGATGTVAVNAGTLQSTNGDIVLASKDGGAGNSGSTGTLTVGGGSATCLRLIIADALNSTGTVTLNSGAVTASQVIFGGGDIGGTSVGTFTLNGGTLTANSLFEGSAAVNSTFNFNGGTLKAGASTGAFMQGLNAANVQAGGAIIDTAGYAVTIAQALAAGASNGGLTKNGAGTLTLTNQATGNPLNMTVNAGTLKLAVGGLAYTNAVGASNGGSLTVASGATLELNQPYNASYGTPVILQGGTLNITAASSGDGANYVNNLTFTGGGNVIGNPIRFGEISNALITVNGTVGATISSNVKLLNTTAPGVSTTFNVVNPAGNLAITGAIADLGTAGCPLIKTGPGTLTLTGANTYTGNTTVNQGKLSLQDTTANTINGAVSIASGAILSADTASGNNVHLLSGNLTLTGGTLAGNGNVSHTDAGQFYFSNAGQQVLVSGDIQSTIAAEMHFRGTHTFNVADGAAPVDLLVSGKLSHYHGVEWGGVVKSGAGTMELASSMDGTNSAGQTGIFGLGGFELQQGTLIFDGSLGYSAFTPASKAGYYLANFTGPSTLKWGVGNTMDVSVNGNLRIGGGVTATLDTGANNVTLGTAIVVGGAGAALTKTGTGTLTLTGSNTYTGNTTVNQGKLSLQDTTANTINGAVSIASGATLAAETASGNNVHLLNGNLTLTGGTLAGNANVSDSTVGQFYFSNAGQQVIVSGDVQSTIAAEMHFAGTHTFNVADGAAPVDLLVTGKLSHQHGVLWGGVVKSGAGTMELASSMDGTNSAGQTGIFGLGGFELQAGTLIFDGSLGYSAFTPASKAGYYLANFTGPSTLKWGVGNTMDVSVNGNLRIGGGVTATLDTGANNVTLGTAIVVGGAGAALTKTGTGTLTLTGANTYTGNTTVTGGTLRFSGGGLSGGNNLYVGNGAGSVATMVLDGSVGSVVFNGGTWLNGVYIGRDGATGTVAVNAGTLQSTNGDIVLASKDGGAGNSGSTGTLTVGGGSATCLRLIIADALNSTGTVTLNSGAVTASQVIFGGGDIGGTSVGTFTLNGGTLTAGSILEGSAAVNSTFNFNGGTLKAGANTGTFLQGLNAANVQAGGAVIDTAGYSDTIAQALAAAASNGGLTKNGAGTLTLTSQVTSNPLNMTVNAGTLKLADAGLVWNNAIGASNGGTLTVQPGATLELNQFYNVASGTPVVLNGGTLNITANNSSDGVNYVNNLTFTGGGNVTGNPIRFGEISNALVTVNGTVGATINTNVRLLNASGGGVSTTFNVVDPAGNLTINGGLSDLGTAGCAVVKSGPGTLVLAAANSYTGATTINGGTVSIAAGAGQYNWYNTVSSTRINAGGVLSLAGGSTPVHNLTLAGGTLAGTSPDATYGTWGFSSGETINVTGSTPSTISAVKFDSYNGGALTFNVDSGSTLNVTGTIGGNPGHAAFGITKAGPGTMVLTGANVYTGNTTVTGGTLEVSGGGLAGGNNLYVGNGAGSTAAMILDGAAGTVAFNGGTWQNGVYIGRDGATGTLTVNAGTFQSTNGDITLASKDGGSGNSGSTGTLTVGGGAASCSRLIIADALNGTGTVILNSGAVTAPLVIFGGGDIAGTTVGTFNLNGGTLTANTIFEGSAAVNSTFNFNGGTLKAGANTGTFLQGLNAANVQAGGAVIDTAGYAVTIAQALAAGASNGGLTKNGAGTLTLTSQATGSPLNMTVNAGKLTLAVGGLVWNNAVGASNGGSLTVASGATLELNQPYNASYGTPVILQGGTLNIVGYSGTDGGNYVNNLTFTGGGNVTGNPIRFGEISNATVTVNGTTAATISSNVRLLNTTAPGVSATFNVVDPAGNLTINGAISDLGTAGCALVKTGPGTQILSGANSYTGSTTVNAGRLVFSGAQTTNGSTSMVIAGGATLEYAVASGIRDENRVTYTGTGTLLKTGAGSVRWGAVVGTFNLGAGSLIDVQGGVLDAGSNANEVWSSNLSSLNVASGATIAELAYTPSQFDALTGAGTVSLDSAAGPGPHTFTLGVNNTAAGVYNAAGTATFSGVISNGGALIKTGTGTQIFSGANTYTGGTTVNNGTLLVNNTTGSGTGSGPVVVNGGMLGGNGSIAGNVTINAAGNVGAGNSPGHLILGGNYVQGGTMHAELGGTTQGVSYDWIDVGGTATFNTGAIVDVTAFSNWPSPGEGIPYYILTATGGITNNDLSGITFDFSAAPGWLGEWKASIVPYPAGGVNAEALMVEAVPEPATMALLGLAAAGLGGYLRRRRS